MNSPFNAGERKDVRRAQKRAKQAELTTGIFIKQMMSTIEGRQFANDFLESTHVFATSFNRDPIAMAFAEGERNIGLKLLGAIMLHAADHYIQMQREANDRYYGNDRSSAAASVDEHDRSEDPGRNAQGSAIVDYDPLNSGVEAGWNDHERDDEA